MEPVIIAWTSERGEPGIRYLDQRALPFEIRQQVAHSVDDVVAAIESLAVRGAPAIGLFGGYGVALASALYTDEAAFRDAVRRIRGARPTAVNLAWAVDRVASAAPSDRLAVAEQLAADQRAIDTAIGHHGIDLMPRSGAVLTHCNTGPLATGGLGTALGVIIAAVRAGRKLHVYVDETRPLLQGARLTTFELAAAGIAGTLIVDSAAAATMRAKAIGAVIVGADRIARNGDTANKIGTYGLAIAAAHHRIPFYVAAPRSTIDFALADGSEIEIEERAPSEVRGVGSAATAPPEYSAYNPAFDVTPGHLITGIITEYGVVRPPFGESIPELPFRPDFAAVASVRA